MREYDDMAALRIERLQEKLSELTKRVQRVPADSDECRHISGMLDDVVHTLRRALRAQMH